MTKAVTLTQPWASLVALGVKRIETRSWATSYRGLLLVHAAKGWTRDDIRFAIDLHRRGLLTVDPHDLPHGAIVAVTSLADVQATRFVRASEREQLLGNFDPGRFAWFLSGARPVDPPLPWRGALGLWEGPTL